MLHDTKHEAERDNVVRLHSASSEEPRGNAPPRLDACAVVQLTSPAGAVGRHEESVDEKQTDADIREACIRLLTRREHTRLELTRWLLARGYAEHLVEVALQRLVDDGLQSDRRFAEAFVRVRVERGQGPILIRAELQARGIDEALSAPLLGLDDEDWRRQAASALRRHYHGALPRSCSERAKHARFLLGRGFPRGVVGRVLASL